MATYQPSYPAYPPQPGQPGGPNYGWAVAVDQGPPPAYYPNSTPQSQPAPQQQPTANMYGGSSTESGGLTADGGFSFSDKAIRRAFIRKVFGILMVQLTVTFGFIALFVYEPSVKEHSQRHPEMFWIGFAMTFILLIVLSCCSDFRRRFPLNIILLSLFTLCEGFMLGSVTALYKADDVLIAAGICAAVCFGLMVFAMQTKIDFTVCSGFLFVSVLVLFIFGIVAMCIPGKVISMVYASLGALIFSLYLVFDTQMMMGGKHKYSISPEEYIFAALNLYLDIINIFMYILALVGGSRN